jgi:hypothetical protein
VPIVSCVEEITVLRGADSTGWNATIRCSVYHVPFTRRRQVVLSPNRKLAAQALILLMRLDSELKYARADWNPDRFRRVMRVRPKAVARLLRRWDKLNPSPRIPLGNLRRRYHANLAGHLYPVSQD